MTLDTLRAMTLVLRSEGCEQDPASMRWRGPDGRAFTDAEARALWERHRSGSS